MPYLIAVSILWAFSFGLIGNALAGVDPALVAAARLGIAGLVFLPFLRPSAIPQRSHCELIACGAVQFGIMYVCYIQAFDYLPSHLVALFSILTPLYVVAIHDLRQKRFHRNFLFAALLSIAGAAIIKARADISGSVWIGFGLMQIAGLAFGFGQVYYRDWKRKHPKTKDRQIFVLLYLGGFLVASLAALIWTDWPTVDLDTRQVQVLFYLGVVASGLGFFLWNKGATLCRPGTLAAFNNAVVPLAMACSLFIFGEVSEVAGSALIRLLLGSGFIAAAVILAEKTPRES